MSNLNLMDNAPPFEEAWQAQVMAMADALIADGTFKPADWSGTLGRYLAEADISGAHDTLSTYYDAALKALGFLLDREGALSRDEVTSRRDAWERAYLATPHGQPVMLKETP